MSLSQTHAFSPLSGPLIGQRYATENVSITAVPLTDDTESGVFYSRSIKAGVYSVVGNFTLQATVSTVTITSVQYNPGLAVDGTYNVGEYFVMGPGCSYALASGSSLNMPVNTVIYVPSDTTMTSQALADFSGGTLSVTAYKLIVTRLA